MIGVIIILIGIYLLGTIFSQRPGLNALAPARPLPTNTWVVPTAKPSPTLDAALHRVVELQSLDVQTTTCHWQDGTYAISGTITNPTQATIRDVATAVRLCASAGCRWAHCTDAPENCEDAAIKWHFSTPTAGMETLAYQSFFVGDLGANETVSFSYALADPNRYVGSCSVLIKASGFEP